MIAIGTSIPAGGGGGGGSQDLQSVLTVGNVANIGIVEDDGAGHTVRVLPAQIIVSAGGDVTRITASIIGIDDAAGNIASMSADDINITDGTGEFTADMTARGLTVSDLTTGASLGIGTDGIGGTDTQYKDGAGNQVKQVFDTLSSTWVQVYPDAGGLIQISGYGMQYPTVQVSAATTVSRDMYAILCDCTTSNVTLIFSAAFGSGSIYTIKKKAGANNLIIEGTGCTFDGSATLIITVIGQVVTLIHFGSGAYYIF